MRISSASKKYQLDLGSFDDEDKADIRPHTSLTWRGDPKETISDWTIIVKGKASNNHIDNNTRRTTNKKSNSEEEEEGESDTIILGTYHVHKGVLAAGTWRSTYFEALFKNHALGSLRENTTHTSVVELDPLAAAAVPTMLDHIYFGTETFDDYDYNDHHQPTSATTTTNTGTSTVALRWLAKYFGIRTLFAAATADIDRDLTVDTAIRYLEESIVFGDDKIISAVVHVCASNIHLLTDAHWMAFSPTVFCDVVRGSVKRGDGDGEDGTSMDLEDLHSSGHHLTRVVANYCRLHPEVVNSAFLESVMGEETVTRIAPDESLFLLSLCLAHNSQNGDCTKKKHSDAGTLMDRTMEICMAHWEEVLSDTPLLLSSATATNTTTNTNTNDNDNNYIEQPGEGESDDGSAPPKHDFYSEFPDETKVKMLEGALQTAKRELDDARSRLRDLYVEVGSEKAHVRKLRAALEFTTKCLKDGDSIARGGRKRKDKKPDKKRHK